MIDIHTHVLPCIDDGSQSVEESLKLLDIMVSSGVRKIVATPHYYCDMISIEDFLEKRREAHEKIVHRKPHGIDIILGAEVKLEYDIHKKDLRKLTIDGTDYILIEMPYTRWDPWVFEELFKITAKHGLNIIIAHIDRYIDMVCSEKMDELFKMHLKYQVNVDYLGGFLKKSNAMTLIKQDVPHFLGSDCHNLTTRTPCFGEAVEKIRSRCGEEYVKYYMSNAKKMLANKSLD